MVGTYNFLAAVVLGVLPALIWLWFWLREDNKSPEPSQLIARAFLAGMLAVPLVLPFQMEICGHFNCSTVRSEHYGILMILLWAGVEEVFKFSAAYFTVFHRREFDEPIDVVIYLITAALGFVALENALFLLSPIAQNDVINTIITSDFRFVGANLLHVIASATVGICIAFRFYGGTKARVWATIIGLLIATALHTLFNFFIMNGNGENTFIVFSILWISVAALMLFFEKIKTLAH